MSQQGLVGINVVSIEGYSKKISSGVCVETGDVEIFQLGVRVGNKKDNGFGNT